MVFFFIQETHHENYFHGETIKEYAVKDEETAIRIKDNNILKYLENTIWVLENYGSFAEEMIKEEKQGEESDKEKYYDEIIKFCDFELLDDLMTEILEKDISDEEKYNDAILTITENCFCATTFEEITDDDLAEEIITRGKIIS
tara:strand:+ start:855 stop:1286 length:432 start_codon:yes stop_codon:yes gene_type:complete